MAETRWDQSHKDEVTEFLTRDLPDGSVDLLDRYKDRSAGMPAVYMSHPITTGPRYLDWRKKVTAHGAPEDASYGEALKQEVMADNIRSAAPLRRQISEAFSDRAVIDPTEVDVPQWKQWDYHRFWAEVIERFVDTAVFADGWQYSTGCAVEYAVILDLGLEALDARLEPLTAARAHELLQNAAIELAAAKLPNSITLAVARRSAANIAGRYKDEKLAHIALEHNVASFVSFSADSPRLRYQVTPSKDPCHRVAEPEEAITFLFRVMGGSSVNVRTFVPEPSKSLPFFYGIDSPEEAIRLVRKCADEGLFTIVNETVDVNDGGVSGVTLGGIAEFSPDDTPRAVEKLGTAALPITMANRILTSVYGVPVNLPHGSSQRVEFSLHPACVGFRKSHVLVWEVEEVEPVALEANINWPNNFSRLVGDKAFGLLVADSLGIPVPQTTVVSRRVAPFQFGRQTGTGEWWLRTAPVVQEPGHFTTQPHWTDPYHLLAIEDPDGSRIASVLAQEGVDAEFSGATAPSSNGPDLVEGVAGKGDQFMLGATEPIELPSRVISAVGDILDGLREDLGIIRIEWAFDTHGVWVLQLHRLQVAMPTGVLSPGFASLWVDYDPRDGLDVLGELIAEAKRVGAGVTVTRPIGVTSHVGDLLRKAKVPGRVLRDSGRE